MRGLKLLQVLLLVPVFLFAQIPTESWETHFSYNEGASVVVAGNEVFAVGSGFLFSYNTSDNSLKTYSKLDGLNDVNIAFVRYHEARNLLFIGYENGNIDLLSDNSIINIQDIKLATITGSKRLNNVWFHDNLAYVASEAGIVVLNLDRKEVKETYILRAGSGQNPVNGVALHKGVIYAATNNGLYKCDANNLNILDFSQWEFETSFPQYNERYADISVFNDELLAVKAAGLNTSYVVYKADNGTIKTLLQGGVRYRSLQVYPSNFMVSSLTNVYLFNNEPKLISNLSKYGFPELLYPGQDAIRASDVAFFGEGVFYVADINHGLVRVETEGPSEILKPDGPSTNILWDMETSPGGLRIVHGALDQSWNNLNKPAEISVLKDNSWTIINNNTVPGIENAVDFVSIATDPLDPERFFAASYRYGLYEFKNNELVYRYYDENSNLENIIPTNMYIRIHGLVFDSEGNLWLNNNYVFNPIHQLKAGADDFNSYNYPEIDNSGADKKFSLGQMIITQNNNKWLVVPRGGGGVYVFNDNGTPGVSSDDQTRMLSLLKDVDEEFDFASNIVCIAEDTDGAIWVGTDNGIGVYYSPDNVFDDGSFLPSRIKLPRIDDTDNGADFLLNNEWINAIEVDGGNRKWIGTMSSGVFLVSPDGLTTINHFTKDNSPLPSNTVNSIAIDPITGEVFIGTAAGLVSFGGDATQGNETFDQLKAFPNPVRENFSGVVTISGLVAETVVKITDISGNLVYETISNGGSVSWDRRNVFGQNVGTGVYIIYCASKDGSQSALTKLLIINSKR